MTRTITIGLVALAFVAGSILTASVAHASPEKGLDNLGQRIKSLEDIIQIDPDTKNVHIKSQSGLSLEAGEGNEISVNTKASFQEDTELKKNAKISGKTQLDDGATVMGDTSMQSLETSTDAAIGGMVTVNAGTGDQSTIYSVVETFTSGNLNTINCRDESHLAVAGSAVTFDGYSREHRTMIRNNALTIDLNASEVHPVTGVLLCVIIQ